jgi:hypothetical protein
MNSWRLTDKGRDGTFDGDINAAFKTQPTSPALATVHTPGSCQGQLRSQLQLFKVVPEMFFRKKMRNRPVLTLKQSIPTS